MEHLSTIAQWRDYAVAVRASGRRVGLVATMGALHEGHQSLVRAARAAGDVVVLTSFVNPRQFSDPGDLAAYPHTPESDVARARDAGVDAFVTPSLTEMWPEYPAPTYTTVSVARLGEGLEGVDRPGHFDGVASVVSKLFAITGPCRAYFGEKDYQQLVVVRRLARDLGFDVDVVGCPTQRAPGGLALSSRNARLSDEGRSRAVALYDALCAARESSEVASVRRELMRRTLEAAGVDVAYAEVVDAESLVPLDNTFRGDARALVAGVVEGVRLIDNAAVTFFGPGGDDAASH